MERRKLLQALTALPIFPLLTVNGRTQSAIVALELEKPRVPPGKFLFFIDSAVVDTDLFLESLASTLPEGSEGSVIPLHLYRGQTIDDVIKIYNLEEEHLAPQHHEANEEKV